MPSCSECGREILEVTASKTGGLCRPCFRRRPSSTPPAPSPFVPPPMAREPAAGYPFRPYPQWPSEPAARWVHAGHTFGMHLMRNVCAEALRNSADKPLTATERALIEKTVFSTAYAMMQLFDGFFVNPIDSEHVADYVLSMRIRRRSDDANVETFELAPSGDGLCMGIHGWWEGEFWLD
jgi:hypothetical protein